MTPKQVAEVLVAMAELQNELLTELERGPSTAASAAAIRQSIQKSLAGRLGFQKPKPITVDLLPAKLLSAALAPGSLAAKSLRADALQLVSQLLK